jgi:sugar/nucleoside kinase (ribokinase family)
MVAQPKGTGAKTAVVGVGSALVDILTRESEEFLAQTGAIKGGMVYVDREHIDRVLAQSATTPTVVPGGSACNTAVGVSKLGGAARFIGRCGRGAMGKFFENALLGHGVEPMLTRSDSPTGRVLSIITPDAERSMFTFLGAAAEIQPQDIGPGSFDGAAIVHVEGYLLFNPAVMRAALAAAKAAGAMVSLDLASFNVVEESRALLVEVVREYVDILIANEDEARAYSGHADPQPALKALSRDVGIAALKLGPRGSLVACDGEIVRVPPEGDGHAVDTTGAGDLWAAGFLFGLTQGYPLSVCGAIGSACGYEVCQVVGASLPEQGWQRIRKALEKPGKHRYKQKPAPVCPDPTSSGGGPLDVVERPVPPCTGRTT